MVRRLSISCVCIYDVVVPFSGLVAIIRVLDQVEVINSLLP